MSITLLRDYLGFIRQPNSEHEGKLSFIFKILRFFRLWGLAIIGNILMLFLGGNLLELLGSPIDQSQNSIAAVLDGKELWKILLMVAVAAPVMEELIFRFGMKKSKKHWKIRISLILWVFFFLTLSVGDNTTKLLVDNITNIIGVDLLLPKIILGAILIFVLVFWMLGIKSLQGFYDKILGRYFRLWFWFLTGTFALAHVSNYSDIKGLAWLVSPLLILPQLLTGTILGYLRVKFGFIWAVCFHGFFNGILAVIAFGAKNLVKDPQNPPEVLNLDQGLYLFGIFGVMVLVLGLNIWNVVEFVNFSNKSSKISTKQVLKF